MNHSTSESAATAVPEQRLQQQFSTLASSWKKQTRLLSSMTEMILHPAYQRIIGMGEPAVPLILRELQREPDYWFWALFAITGENPMPPDQAGALDEFTAAWLKWGQDKGYI